MPATSAFKSELITSTAKRVLIYRKCPGAGKALDADKLKAEKIKASVRAKVKHPLRYIKQVAFSNLLIGEKYLLA